MPLLLAFLLFCALGLVLLGLTLPHTGRDPVAARLAQFAERPRTLEELELEQPFSERVLQPIIRKLASYGERFTRRGGSTRGPQRRNERIERTRRRLTLAGNPNRWTASDWLGVKLFAGLLGGGLGAVLIMLLTDPAFLLLGVVVGAVIGFIAPEFWLSRKIAARQKEIVRTLPDVLDLLVISVEAGLGFDAALARVVAKSDNALTQELNRVMAEMRVGRPRREALRDMVARTEVPDLANFVSALIQAEQLGVSVSQVLHVQAEHLRVVRRQRAEEQAQQAPLKMLFPMLIFIFPALCIIILGPLWPAINRMR
ncbi:MAG: type II secretion system F family protein [Chloroflexi bacterium]|nr:type II secretion system F family protein [Chloroflexota bacterium]